MATLASPNAGTNVIIGPSWTRGLAVHPVGTRPPSSPVSPSAHLRSAAAGVTFLALLASLSTHLTVQLIASVLSFLAAVITLIAFAIDIALYVYIKHQVHKLAQVDGSTNTAPGTLALHFPHPSTPN
jgi:hypothetical protein